MEFDKEFTRELREVSVHVKFANGASMRATIHWQGLNLHPQVKDGALTILTAAGINDDDIAETLELT